MRYYKVNARRLPLSIVWSWGSIGGFFAFLIFFKLLRVMKYGPVLISAEPGVSPVADADVSAGDRADLEPVSAELIAAGLVPIMYYRNEVVGPVSGLARLFLSGDGRYFAGVSTARSLSRFDVSIFLVSVSSEGSILSTSSTVLRWPEVPGNNVVRLPGARARDLLNSHLPRLASRVVRQLAVADVVRVLYDLEERALKHYVSIGLYEPASASDIERYGG